MPVRVAYDENCDFCSFVRDVVERYDDSGEMDFIPNTAGIRTPSEPGAEQPDRISILDSQGNRTSDGIDTVIYISRKIKILFPLYPLLRLARLVGVGQISYDLIARNRMLISRILRRMML